MQCLTAAIVATGALWAWAQVAQQEVVAIRVRQTMLYHQWWTSKCWNLCDHRAANNNRFKLTEKKKSIQEW